MNPDVSLLVIARQLVLHNQLKIIELHDLQTSSTDDHALYARSMKLIDITDIIEEDEKLVRD